MRILVLCLLAASAFAEPRRYAVVVANNASGDAGVAPLSYADDDGARYFELFRAAGAEVALLTVLDASAQRRHPEAAQAAQAPKKSQLTAVLDGFFARMRADHDAGRETHFYLVYSGHGNLGPNREGYVHFLDGALRRSDLYHEVLARSPASFNHLIIDACHAYFLVNKRGAAAKDGDFRAAMRAFLRTEELDSYPNTGVILAASSESETHEWSRWEAGIFSHELQSGLLGAADVDGNGGVSYAEAAAFVEAANAAIDVPRARLRVFYRPPPLRVDVPLLDTSFAGAPSLRIDAAHAARYHVEDGRGVRIADLHPSPEQPVRLALVGKPPFFLESGPREAALPERQQVEVGELTWGPVRDATRGSVETSFRRHLFELPFGIGFLNGMASSAPVETSQRRPARPLRGWAIGTLSAGAALAIAGGVTYYYAGQAHQDYAAASGGAEARRLHALTDDRLLAAQVLFGVAGVSAAAALSLLVADLVPRRSPTLGNLSAGIGPGGIFFAGQW